MDLLVARRAAITNPLILTVFLLQPKFSDDRHSAPRIRP